MSPIISRRKGLPSLSCAITLIIVVMNLGACAPTTQIPPSTFFPVSSSIEPVSPLATDVPSPTASALAEDWSYRWLKGIPCRPPCWEGITPGQTTAREAEDILRKSPIISMVETATTSSRPAVGTITWNWANTGKEGGGALFDPESFSSPIYLIHPYFPISFKFSDIIRVYGEPSHVVAKSLHNPDDTLAYELTILYLSQGMLFGAGHGSTKPILQEDTRLNGPSFFVPSYDGLRTAYIWAQSHPEWLVPWQGMKDFDFYCQDEVGGSCP